MGKGRVSPAEENTTGQGQSGVYEITVEGMGKSQESYSYPLTIVYSRGISRTMNATNEEKLTQQAREAVAKVLTEIELKLMSVYLQGLQDGMDRAKQIINGNEV